MAYVPAETNSYKDQDVRRILAPLARLAADTGVALVLVRHLNKSGGNHALYRGGGSIGIVGAARSGLLVAIDPADDTRRVLASIKSNLALSPESMAYRVVSADTGVGRIEWEGASPLSANELMAIPQGEERSALREAEDFLRDVLAGGPMPAKEVQREARDAAIAERTLRRAREGLGVVTARREHRSEWSLPIGSPSIPTATPPTGPAPDASQTDLGDGAANLANLANAEGDGHVGQLQLAASTHGVAGADDRTSLANASTHGQVGHVGQVDRAGATGRRDPAPPDWMGNEFVVTDAYAAAAAAEADADVEVARALLRQAREINPEMTVSLTWDDG